MIHEHWTVKPWTVAHEDEARPEATGPVADSKLELAAEIARDNKRAAEVALDLAASEWRMAAAQRLHEFELRKLRHETIRAFVGQVDALVGIWAFVAGAMVSGVACALVTRAILL